MKDSPKKADPKEPKIKVTFSNSPAVWEFPSQWDLSVLMKSDEDAAQDLERTEIAKSVEQFVSKHRESKDYLTSAPALKNALDEYEKLSRLISVGGGPVFTFTCVPVSIQLITKLRRS